MKKIDALINAIKDLTNEKELGRIIEAAMKRQSYLTSGDLEKLCLDLIEKVGFGDCIILQGFSKNEDGEFIPIKDDKLLDGNVFLYGLPGSRDYPINTFLGEYLNNPEVNELWSTIKKVYDDIRYDEDLKSIKENGGYDASEIYVAMLVDEVDYSPYIDLIAL